ncbi:MAG: serine/threonine-protein kinase [Deltaproteobacteria bacterium]|nr:serine/threonine-protein kinase [Deltaproteobacteria bacterium]
MSENSSIVGTTVGNYEVKKLIGEGAMGEVFLGEHPKIGRKVAIKVLIASLSSDPEMSERFLSEAKAVNRINHPNIIEVFDFGKLPDGRLYLTMEYLEGIELEGKILEAPMELHEISMIFKQISDALQAAHEQGIIHRDLKPDNIFITKKGNKPLVKILDFGVAKLLEPGMGNKHKTATGLIMGTPSYMSPEQAAGRIEAISAPSDIYSLGIIVYQMISGRLPLEDDVVPQLLVKHISEPPTPIYEYVPNFPPNLWMVLKKSLEKDPGDRYEQIIDFYNDFQSNLEKVEKITISDTISQDIPSGSLHNQGEVVSGKLNLKSFVLTGVFLLGAAGGGIYYFWPASSDNHDMTFEKTSIERNNKKTEKAKSNKKEKKIKEEIKFSVKVETVDKTKIKVSVKTADNFRVLRTTPFELKILKDHEIEFEPLHPLYKHEKQKVKVQQDRVFILQKAKASSEKKVNRKGDGSSIAKKKSSVKKKKAVMKHKSNTKRKKSGTRKKKLGEDTYKVMW